MVDPNAALPRVLMETTAAGTATAYYVYGLGLISREDATTYQNLNARVCNVFMLHTR